MNLKLDAIVKSSFIPVVLLGVNNRHLPLIDCNFLLRYSFMWQRTSKEKEFLSTKTNVYRTHLVVKRSMEIIMSTLTQSQALHAKSISMKWRSALTLLNLVSSAISCNLILGLSLSLSDWKGCSTFAKTALQLCSQVA